MIFAVTPKGEPMDDLISRQAAIDAIKGLNDTPNGYSDTYDKECIIGVLEDLPSAEAVPERKKGRWIEVDDEEDTISGKCSVCGWEAHLYEDDVVDMPYCPNCGAHMEGAEEK